MSNLHDCYCCSSTTTWYPGQVFKGWDLSIKTMKKFDVELLSWASVKDICIDGGIFKKIVKEGEKWENPKDLDEVLVRYEARLEDGTLVGKSDGVEYIVQEGRFCPALAKDVKTMKKGEKMALVRKAKMLRVMQGLFLPMLP